MNGIVIFMTIYVLPVITTWWVLKKGYKEVWIDEKPNEIDLVLVFMPIANIMTSLYIGLELFLKKRNKKFIQWFFRL